jgi:hypothetical protein
VSDYDDADDALFFDFVEAADELVGDDDDTELGGGAQHPER